MQQLFSVKLNRNLILWILGSICFPVLIPLILVFLKEKKVSIPPPVLEAVKDEVKKTMTRSMLLGSAVCRDCQVLYEISKFHGKKLVCETCHSNLIRFTTASLKTRSCSQCGVQFADASVALDDSLADSLNGVIRGFECLKCGQVVCGGCAGKDADKKLTYACSCGGELAVRI